MTKMQWLIILGTMIVSWSVGALAYLAIQHIYLEKPIEKVYKEIPLSLYKQDGVKFGFKDEL